MHGFRFVYNFYANKCQNIASNSMTDFDSSEWQSQEMALESFS